MQTHEDNLESSLRPISRVSGMHNISDRSEDRYSRRRRDDLPELERLSVSRLRHHNVDVQSRRAPSQQSLRSDAPLDTNVNDKSCGPGALRQERRLRNALHEQDLHEASVEARRIDRFGSRGRDSAQQDLVDESSGTEGSGPVVGNRRRKKSSTGSSSKKAANRATQTLSRVQVDTDVGPSSEQDRPDANLLGGQNTRRRLPMQTERAYTTRRSALPPDFRNKQESSWQKAHNKVNERPSYVDDQSGRSTRSRSGTYFSDDRTQQSTGRISQTSWDTLRHSSAQRGPPVRQRDEDSENQRSSPSENARLRKISAASSASLRSSGGASDLHRAASRGHMRQSHGRDVFDDAPPLPENSQHPLSPVFSTTKLPQNSAEHLVRSTESRQSTRASNLNELRARIDKLAGPTHQRSVSRTSSGNSRSYSHGSTPSHSLPSSATSVRPATEPRKSGHDRAFSEISHDIPRNANLGELEGTSRPDLSHTPSTSTPGLSGHKLRRSASRMTTPSFGADVSFTSRQNARGRTPASVPLHAKNLSQSFDAMERHFVGLTLDHASTDETAHEIPFMVSKLKEVCSAALDMNADLLCLLQEIVEDQIDVEIKYSNQSDLAEVLTRVEKSLSVLLRRSDEQVRSLAESLVSIVKLGPDNVVLNSVDESKQAYPQTRSASHLGSSHRFLNRENDSGSLSALERRSSLDFRRPSKADTIRQSPLAMRSQRRASMHLSPNTPATETSPSDASSGENRLKDAFLYSKGPQTALKERRSTLRAQKEEVAELLSSKLDPSPSLYNNTDQINKSSLPPVPMHILENPYEHDGPLQAPGIAGAEVKDDWPEQRPTTPSVGRRKKNSSSSSQSNHPFPTFPSPEKLAVARVSATTVSAAHQSASSKPEGVPHRNRKMSVVEDLMNIGDVKEAKKLENKRISINNDGAGATEDAPQ